MLSNANLLATGDFIANHAQLFTSWMLAESLTTTIPKDGLSVNCKLFRLGQAIL